VLQAAIGAPLSSCCALLLLLLRLRHLPLGMARTASACNAQWASFELSLRRRLRSAGDVLQLSTAYALCIRPLCTALAFYVRPSAVRFKPLSLLLRITPALGLLCSTVAYRIPPPSARYPPFTCDICVLCSPLCTLPPMPVSTDRVLHSDACGVLHSTEFALGVLRLLSTGRVLHPR
jgi:hypothetical protein